jgi:hypothetical protein
MKKLSLFSIAAILAFVASTVPLNAETFYFELTKNIPEAHFDVTSGPGIWSFHVEVTGKVNSLSFPIKNSAPGAADFCSAGSGPPRNPKGIIDFDTSPIPEAACQACGTTWFDTNGSALALVGYLQTGDRNARVQVWVTYPDPDPDQPYSSECPSLP